MADRYTEMNETLKDLTPGYYAVVKVDDPEYFFRSCLNRNPVHIFAVRRNYDAAVEAARSACRYGGMDLVDVVQMTDKGLRFISWTYR